MLWIAILALLSWIGTGVYLLRREPRRAGRDYQRQVSRQIVARDEEVEVVLRLVPPFQIHLTADRDVLLVLDHSGSMGGGPGSPLEEAVRAAENFVRRCPPQVHLGLVSFDHEAQIAYPVSGEPRQVLRALGAIGSGGGTAIHRALDRARETLTDGRSGVGKTVILLSDGGSDRPAAELAAERLRSDPSVQVICVGFGPSADAELMTAVAGAPERYCHVSDPDDLFQLFGFLAAAVSGQMAVAGLVDEGVRAPAPFHLTGTGGLYPVGVHAGQGTRILWSVPLLDLQAVALTYRLAPQCPGWHPVARDDARATWRMPDGSVVETPGPRGPRVLVLPQLLTWAWPLLNPLFWMLFGRFFCRPAPASAELPEPEPEALPEPAFPQPLPEPWERPYQPEIRPALVIGLGEVGDWTLCRLVHRLQDRAVDPGGVEHVCITATHRANRVPARIGGIELEAADRVELACDLRPYVEGLRDGAAPASRSWVPWRSWLAAMSPLTTAHTLGDDRRKARLALLLGPAAVEDRLRDPVQRVLDRDGLIVVVAAAGDAEGSGLLGEVAHVCATYGGSATAVLVRRRDDDLAADGVVALGRELERMVALRGDGLLSDRRNPSCEARKLFDRILVLSPGPQEPAPASENAADLVWCLLAYPEVERRMPTARPQGERVLCGQVDLDVSPLPALHLWRWVRDRTLAQGVNRRWLGLQVTDGALRLPGVPREVAAGYAAAFWAPAGFVRPQGRLLVQARAILQGQSPVSALLDQLPVDALYDEQVAFSRAERRTFAAFCEEWCQSVLAVERDKGAWGLPALAAALQQIEKDLQTVLERIERLSGSDDFRNLARLASGLFFDLSARLQRLREGLSPWIAALAGEQVDLGVAAVPAARPLCQELERAQQASEEALILPGGDAVRRRIEQRFEEWRAEYGEAFLAQVGFRVALPPGSLEPQVQLHLCGEQLTVSDDLAARFWEALDRYRGAVLSWPLQEELGERPVADAPGRLRIGGPAAQVYPRVREGVHEEDPAFAAALGVREMPLDEALGIAGVRAADPQFAWPEESNALRVAEKVRNSALRREPAPFSPLLVHLLRDPERLHAFFADLALGRVDGSDGDCRLLRNGHELPVGKASEGLPPTAALDNFEAIARRVVAVGTALDGRLIPDATEIWTISPEEALEKVEGHPLAKAALGAPQWAAWRDVIQGVALDVRRGKQDDKSENPQES